LCQGTSTSCGAVAQGEGAAWSTVPLHHICQSGAETHEHCELALHALTRDVVVIQQRHSGLSALCPLFQHDAWCFFSRRFMLFFLSILFMSYVCRSACDAGRVCRQTERFHAKYRSALKESRKKRDSQIRNETSAHKLRKFSRAWKFYTIRTKTCTRLLQSKNGWVIKIEKCIFGYTKFANNK
jgi:hypothetical protein